MSGFGQNYQKVDNWDTLEASYKKAKVKGGLFYAEKTSFAHLTRLYDDNPETLIVIRNWPDADQHRTMTPDQWLNKYGWQSYGGKLIVGASNESNWDSQLLRWTLELCQKVVALNGAVRVCVINLNSGHNLRSQWAEAHEILKLACKYPKLIYIGLHEYAGGVITSGFVGGNPDGTVTNSSGGFDKHPGLLDLTVEANWPKGQAAKDTTMWHCGRFKILQDYCEDNFGSWPSVILTEHGFDSLSDIGPWLNSLPRDTQSVNGFKTLRQYWQRIFPGMSIEDAYWKQLVYADENIYRNTCVKVQIIFSRGFNPDWVNYEVGPWMDDKIAAYNAKVEAPPVTIVNDGKSYYVNVPDNAKLNIRPEPNTSKAPISSLPSGSVVEVLNRYLQLNNNWCRINFNGLIGYISLLTNSANVDAVQLVEVQPPPPPETNFDAAIQEIDDIIVKLTSLRELLTPN